jgi:hypothetical protein
VFDGSKWGEKKRLLEGLSQYEYNGQMKKSKAVNKQKQSSKQTAKKKHVTKGTAAARKSQSTTNTKKNIKAVKKVSQAYMDVKSKKWKKGSSNIATDSYNEVPSDLSSQVTTSASEESLTSESDENKVVFRHAYEDPNWEGNEDDRGSVASGILEEDFCQICGLSTLAAGSWSNVILCDVCDSEYHIPCLKMNKVPRSMFVCYKCNKETDAMKNLRFVSDVFRIPRRKIINRAVIYTPSRPLESAFHECVEKGLMVVSEIFPYDVMRYVVMDVFFLNLNCSLSTLFIACKCTNSRKRAKYNEIG